MQPCLYYTRWRPCYTAWRLLRILISVFSRVIFMDFYLVRVLLPSCNQITYMCWYCLSVRAVPLRTSYRFSHNRANAPLTPCHISTTPHSGYTSPHSWLSYWVSSYTSGMLHVSLPILPSFVYVTHLIAAMRTAEEQGKLDPQRPSYVRQLSSRRDEVRDDDVSVDVPSLRRSVDGKTTVWSLKSGICYPRT